MMKFELQGAVKLIAPEIALNQENIKQLTDTVAAKSFTGQPMVVIDMSKVPLVDSAGLEALLDIQQTLRESAGALKLAGLTQLCEDIFRVTGVAERFETFDDTKEAIGSFVR